MIKCPPNLQLISSVVTQNWRDIVQSCDLDNWKEALAALLTYAHPEDFACLCGESFSHVPADYSCWDLPLLHCSPGFISAPLWIISPTSCLWPFICHFHLQISWEAGWRMKRRRSVACKLACVTSALGTLRG